MLLTWNEERNIASCLSSVAAQTARDFEVVIVDAASTDRTVEIARRSMATFPTPIRLDVAAGRIPIGDARNRGVAQSQAGLVAFLSADAELDPRWVEHALGDAQRCDMAWGRQVHAPRAWTVGASVRGLRYRFPDHETNDPLLYASNVAALYKKEILQQFPFDPSANAAEDLLLAQRAHRAGYHAVYDPRLVVHHHDVASARDELRKNVREGQGWALYRGELGLFLPILMWALLLSLGLLLVVLRATWWSLLILLGLVFMPAVRRVLRRARSMPARALVLGLLASPFFDLVFLANYVRGLVAPAPAGSDPRTTTATTNGSQEKPA